MSLDALFTLFTGLPRQGPGSDRSTLEALRRLPPLRKDAMVLDVGCGTGRPTRVLARTLRTRVTGIDIHQPYLDELARAAAQEGLSEFVETRCRSMEALDYAPGSVDLIWSEGAIFVLGVAQALRQWKPLLRPGGLLAFTDVSWLAADPPAEAVAFFAEEYPSITTLEGNRRLAGSEGYEVLDAFPLPAAEWYTEYYIPLRERIAELLPTLATQPELAAVVASTEREMDLFDRFSAAYGYVFYLLRRPAVPAAR
jgi:serine/threonine-protein kinase HipA